MFHVLVILIVYILIDVCIHHVTRTVHFLHYKFNTEPVQYMPASVLEDNSTYSAVLDNNNSTYSDAEPFRS